MEKYEYTADERSTQQAFEDADVVLRGEIIKLGLESPEGMGQIFYSNTEVKIQHLEKGNLPGDTCLLGYQAVSFRDMQQAPTPATGKTYRFYIAVREEGKTLKAFKITDI